MSRRYNHLQDGTISRKAEQLATRRNNQKQNEQSITRQ